jgi:hypothetical protein
MFISGLGNIKLCPTWMWCVILRVLPVKMGGCRQGKWREQPEQRDGANHHTHGGLTMERD